MVVCAGGENVGGSSCTHHQPQKVSVIFYICAPGSHRRTPTKPVAPLGNDNDQTKVWWVEGGGSPTYISSGERLTVCGIPQAPCKLC